jgi:ketosteroid isomerase-like protein
VNKASSAERAGKGNDMDEARTIMQRVTEAAMRGDADTLSALSAVNAVIETPDQGTLSGRDAIAESNTASRTAFPDLSREPVHEHEAGNTAIDEGLIVATHTGPLASHDGHSIPATGRRLQLRMADAATIADGAVTSHRLYFDQLELQRQLGLAPEG